MVWWEPCRLPFTAALSIHPSSTPYNILLVTQKPAVQAVLRSAIASETVF